ncbi:MAG: hemolysin, partial [Parasporobacterium sp.]|nr:hemolysin [Parasporobacterium sp.]
EIVGDIRDEYDESEIIEIVRLSDDHYQVQGHVSLYDVNDRIGTELASDDYDSIGGVIIEQLERFPEEGESVQVGDVTLTAVKMDKTRIELVDIKLGKEAEERKQSTLNID